MRFILHILLTVLLTLATQIGGIVYLLTIIILHKIKVKKRIYRFLTFIFLYLSVTFLVVPNIDPYFGRVKITNNIYVQNHSLITTLCNRNYVKPKLNASLQNIGNHFKQRYPTLTLVYLDANFPFIDKFPLLPHLSHSDGKKIDLSFLYTEAGKFTNKKPTTSGYGIFEEPKSSEYNQTNRCKQKGFWQYDYSKFVTFGSFNADLKFSLKPTKYLIQLILQQKSTQKVFIEPHLKYRMNLNNAKIRFHGCKAVRHDDHIHFQIW